MIDLLNDEEAFLEFVILHPMPAGDMDRSDVIALQLFGLARNNKAGVLFRDLNRLVISRRVTRDGLPSAFVYLNEFFGLKSQWYPLQTRSVTFMDNCWKGTVFNLFFDSSRKSLEVEAYAY